MPSDSSKIPEGWVSVPLKQLVSPSKEKVEPVEEPDVPYIGLEHIESNTTRIIDHGFARDTMSTKTRFFAGSILYGKLRPYLNKVTIPDFSGVCSTDILVFPPVNDIEMRYLMRFLSTRAVVEFATHQSSGMELPRTSFEKIGQLNIPLPPLAEQRRIVARLEALLADTEQVRGRLDAVAATMQRFRQAVLAAAFEGSLTEEWRSINPVEIPQDLDHHHSDVIDHHRKRLADQDHSGNHTPSPSASLPHDWQWIPLGALSTFVTSGSRGWAKYYSDDGAIFIRIGNISGSGITLDLSNIQRVSPPENAEGKRTEVQAQDILISITADIGSVALVPPSLEKAYINQHIALVRPSAKIDPEYAALFLSSESGGRRQFQAMQRGATKIGLGLDDIRAALIPYAPLAEQHEIVRRVEALFALADRIEGEVAGARERVEVLTQAVLAKAFRGELVPTEAELARREGREYEPASELLERVRSERQVGHTKEIPTRNRRSSRQSSLPIKNCD